MEQDRKDDIEAIVDTMTTWLNWLVGLMSCAAILMIVGGAQFAKTFSSGPMTEAARAMNNRGVSLFLLGAAIFVILLIIFTVLAVIRSKTIKKITAKVAPIEYRKVTKLWVLIPILVVGLPVWALLLAFSIL